MKSFYFLATFLLVFFTSQVIQTQEFNKKNESELERGVITIKVKEGVGKFSKQEGIVSFGIASLDEKITIFEVNKLDRRFIHKPIPPGSGLPDLSRIYKIEFPEKYDVVKVAKEFSKDSNIEYAEPIPKIFLLHEPNDSLYSLQWNLEKIQAPEAWDIHKGEDGDSTIILAITDNGSEWGHPDLAGNIWNNLGEDADNDGHTLEWNGSQWIFDPDDINNVDDDANGFTDDFIGWNFTHHNNDPNANANEYHGTNVAGLASAVTNNEIGVASISYNLKCMPVRGLNYNSVIYAAENGADVINCSWGYYTYSIADAEAIEYATGLGSIVVAAAGNESSETLLFPAALPNVIAVAAVIQDDIISYFTSYGAFVDVCAPTGSVWSLGYGVYSVTGPYTSFAAPQVTGLIGLIKSYHPTWTKDQILAQLVGTADNVDLLNPGYEYLLGAGRINAFHSLADSNVIAPQELKLISQILLPENENTGPFFNPGEVISWSLKIQNFSVGVSANNFSITLTTNDPDIQILDGEYNGFLPADNIIELIDEFQIKISPSASTHKANITFQYSAEVPIVLGDELTIEVILNPRGVFVWEGVENGQDYSGTYIRDYLLSSGFTTTYSTNFPFTSLNGWDAIFLSFGNYGTGTSNTIFDSDWATKIEEYLQAGGKVYLEGGDALGFDQAGNANLLSLLGISSTADGTTNPINSLEGQNGNLTQGMLFTSSTQNFNSWIDLYFPNGMGTVAFYESGYGNVAVQGTGTFGQKTLCFSYALSELADENPPSTRDTLIQRILDFFEVPQQIHPYAPILISPVDSVTVDSSSVMFVWSKCQPEVTNYRIELDTTDQFVSPVFIDSVVTDTSMLYSSLVTNKNYWWRVKSHNAAGWSGFSEVSMFSTNISSVNEDGVPTIFNLQQNYPNPFNPITIIKYSIPELSFVILNVYDVLGSKVATFVNEEKPVGSYQFEFDGANFASGVYFYQLKAGSFVETKKMVLMK